jgi:hypothetical protein
MGLDRVFILGDSRTGTLSINNFLTALGFKSKHYFEIESKQDSHTPENRISNFNNILTYIYESGVQCFSDYPTRLYYKELADVFPEAYFILTYRCDVEVWQKSMINFFGKFKKDIDIEELTMHYLENNQIIEDYFLINPNIKFLKICIDDGSEINSKLIKDFLKISSSLVMPKDHQSINVNNEIPSGRHQLMFFDGINPLEQVEGYNKTKDLLSEYGWFFLINDSNNFLRYLFGLKSWSEIDQMNALKVIDKRHQLLNQVKSNYFKFIIPEKSVVYREFLPKALCNLKISEDRPAKILKKLFPKVVSYLDEYLIDVKSYGFIFFRGDSHANWLGAYFIYQYIIKHINVAAEQALGEVIHLSSLHPTLAGYDGDLSVQMTESKRIYINDFWADIQPNGIYEYSIRYELPVGVRRSIDVKPTQILNELNFSRPIIVREILNSNMPTAVIFNDSTASFIVDLLSEHFSRVVFIWHDGEIIKEVLDAEKPDFVIHIMAERFVSAYDQTMQPISSVNNY